MRYVGYGLVNVERSSPIHELCMYKKVEKQVLIFFNHPKRLENADRCRESKRRNVYRDRRSKKLLAFLHA